MDGGGKGGKADASKDVETGPQRLKPGCCVHIYGTTEVAPSRC